MRTHLGGGVHSLSTLVYSDLMLMYKIISGWSCVCANQVWSNENWKQWKHVRGWRFSRCVWQIML